MYMPDGYHPIIELLNECDCCNLYTSEELQDYEIVEMGLDFCTCVIVDKEWFEDREEEQEALMREKNEL